MSVRRLYSYRWCVVFRFQDWHWVQLGVHLDLQARDLYIYVPFGFVHVGRMCTWRIEGHGWRAPFGWQGVDHLTDFGRNFESDCLVGAKEPR